MVGLPLGIL